VGIGELSLGRIRTKKAARKADPLSLT